MINIHNKVYYSVRDAVCNAVFRSVDFHMDTTIFDNVCVPVDGNRINISDMQDNARMYLRNNP